MSIKYSTLKCLFPRDQFIFTQPDSKLDSSLHDFRNTPLFFELIVVVVSYFYSIIVRLLKSINTANYSLHFILKQNVATSLIVDRENKKKAEPFEVSAWN